MPDAAELAARKCVPCHGGTPPLPADRVAELAKAVPEWAVAADGKRITRNWRAKDFVTALEFFRRVADVAEAEDHHPDLHLVGYRNATLELWTHAAGGLTENDFILAAKIDALPGPV